MKLAFLIGLRKFSQCVVYRTIFLP
ncbi:hypothetical protein BOSE29B_140004 [Bosea sp. 29B]|nr:hypothetical protein BOSE29B_140004 [Bosea sp. 29B]